MELLGFNRVRVTPGYHGAKAFISPKGEEAVFNNRATKCTAKEAIVAIGDGLTEERAGIKGVVLKSIMSRPMPIVGSSLGHDLNLRPADSSHVCRRRIRRNTYLCYGVRVWRKGYPPTAPFTVTKADAINKPLTLLLIPAC